MHTCDVINGKNNQYDNNQYDSLQNWVKISYAVWKSQMANGKSV